MNVDVLVTGVFLLLMGAYHAHGLNAHGANVCSYTNRRSYSYHAAVAYTAYENYRTCCKHFMWCWSHCTRSRAVTRYRLETRYRTYYSTHYRCCSGWRQAAGASDCRIAICSNPVCVHGRCSRPNVCDCSNTGYVSSSTGCNTDDNECSRSNGGCQQQCNNYPGGYSCSCRRGFTVHNTWSCRDNDECAVSHRICSCDDAANNPLCSATCQNTIGSYRCLCSSGYRLVGSTRCVDINECMANNGGCDHYCSNVPGSHRCSCRAGYRIDANGTTCSDINECLVNNGGCMHHCINNIGSYQCRCSPGHTLDFNGKTCSDINECELHNHYCAHICNNYLGGFFCTCHPGYKLNSDNKTCSDIDECQAYPNTNITRSGCTQLCSNTIGSFTCSCRSGFILKNDGKTCEDADECNIGSHSCKQECVNTVGSYVCRCQAGYRLNSDGRSCDALPCIRIPPLINGYGSCFSGNTNDTCNLACHVGFTLRGSSMRRCLANHKWSGSLTTCERNKCNELQPPVYGSVVIPCGSYYQASCSVKCSTGYYATGPTNRMCRAMSNNTMFWNNEQTYCKKITVCSPNPCKHNGICTIVNTTLFKCNCHNTGYNGETCSRGIISIPNYPLMKMNITYNFTITAKPDQNLVVELGSKQNGLIFQPSTFEFSSFNTTLPISVEAKESGLHVIQYKIKGENKDVFEQPAKSVVYVKKEIPENQSLSDSVINEQGILRQGCYHSEKLHVRDQVKKPSSKAIPLFSSTPWDGNAGYDSTDGVIVMAIEDTILPTSVAGGSISVDQIVNEDLDKFVEKYADNATTDASAVPYPSKKCISRQPSVKYLTEVVELNSFSKTVVDAINNRPPYWINLFTEPTVKTFQIENYAANIYNRTKLSQIYPECSKLLSSGWSDDQMHVYTTKERMLMNIAEEELDLHEGHQVCIFQSAVQNHTFIGFPTTNVKSINLMQSTGWSGTMKSIEMKEVINGFACDITGNYSTSLTSNTMQVELNVDGRIQYEQNDTSETVSEGLSALNTSRGNGIISFQVMRNVSNPEIDFSFVGQGMLLADHKDDRNGKCPSNSILMKINNPKKEYISHRLKGIINVDKSTEVTCHFSVNETGGRISQEQNETQFMQLHTELQMLNTAVAGPLQNVIEIYPGYRSSFLAIIGDLKQAVKLSEKLLGICKQNSSHSILPSLIRLKKKMEILQREFQVLSVMLEGNHEPLHYSPISKLQRIFKKSFNTANKLLGLPLKRDKIQKIINSYSLSVRGTMCVGDLCFGNSQITVLKGLSQTELEDCYSLRYPVNQTDMIIIGVTGKEKQLGSILTIAKNTKIEYALYKNSSAIGRFNASLSIYGSTVTVEVVVHNNTMRFSAELSLPEASKTNIDASANLSGLRLGNDVLIKIRGFLPKHTMLIGDLNSFLHTKMLKMAHGIKERIGALQKAVNLSEQQQYEASINLHNAKVNYQITLNDKIQIQKNINATVAALERAKSHLQVVLRQYDDAILNYTEAIEKCAPRICVSKCTPGIVKDICYDERYIHVLIKQCTLVTKEYVTTQYQEVSKQSSYITFDSISSCNTRCPPLTGFFRSVFGRRRRGLVKKLMSKLFTKANGVKLFEYLGGDFAGTLAKIGSYLPGKWGVVGMLVGGVIGSAFGSCDKTCQMSYIPKEVTVRTFDVEKIVKTVPYKVSQCKDTITEQPSGFKHPYECVRPSNCSEQMTDVRCISENEQCYRMREILQDKITQEQDLGPVYDIFKSQSLALEAFETVKRFTNRDLKNAEKSLSFARTLAFNANYSAFMARQSLANAKTLLALEYKVAQQLSRYGASSFFVRSGQYVYYVSGAVRPPKALALDIVINGKNAETVFATTYIDFQNVNSSIADASETVIKKIFESSQRSRRSLNTDNSMQETVTIDGFGQNITEWKCHIMEKNILYLIKVAQAFARGIAQFENATREIETSKRLESNFLQLIDNNLNNSSLCNDTDGNCSMIWLSDKYKQLKNNRSSDENMTLLWQTKRTYIISQLEVDRMHYNLTKCAGVRDCVQNSIAVISELVQFEESQLAKLCREAISTWTASYNFILDNVTATQNDTKMHTDRILNSFKVSHPKSVFCDSPPVIIKDLPSHVTAVKGSSFYLNFTLAATDHAVTFSWKKNAVVMKTTAQNSLPFINIDRPVEGFYTCEIVNRFGKVTTTTTRVIYQEPPRVIKHPQGLKIFLKSASRSIILTCNATGTPKPMISWSFLPFNNASYEVQLKHNGSVLHLNATNVNQSGFYYCNGSNMHGFSVSQPANVHVLDSKIAEFAVKVSFSIFSPDTFDTYDNQSLSSNITQEMMPEALSDLEKANLTLELANNMNISISRINHVNFMKQNDREGFLSFDIKTKDLNTLFWSSDEAGWSKMSEDVVFARKGLLILPLWLHHVYGNLSSSITIGSFNASVDANTIDADPSEAKCPPGYSLNTNGFICGICQEGARFSPAEGCTSCPKGTYQSLQGQSHCIQCPENYTTYTTGSVSFASCKPLVHTTVTPITTAKATVKTGPNSHSPNASSTIKTSVISDASTVTSPIKAEPETRGASKSSIVPSMTHDGNTITKTSTISYVTSTVIATTPGHKTNTAGKPPKLYVDKEPKVGLIIGVSFAIVVLVTVVVGICYKKHQKSAGKKKRRASDSNRIHLTEHISTRHADTFFNEIYDSGSPNSKGGGVVQSTPVRTFTNQFYDIGSAGDKDNRYTDAVTNQKHDSDEDRRYFDELLPVLLSKPHSDETCTSTV